MNDHISDNFAIRALFEITAREWSYGGIPAECAVCGAPIQWTGAQYMHVAPAMPLTHDPDADPRYADESIQAGIDLWDWIERTGTHPATLDP